MDKIVSYVQPVMTSNWKGVQLTVETNLGCNEYLTNGENLWQLNEERAKRVQPLYGSEAIRAVEEAISNMERRNKEFTFFVVPNYVVTACVSKLNELKYAKAAKENI